MSAHQPRFSWRSRGALSGIILDGGMEIAEFRDGRLRNAIFKPGGQTIIENEIGLRLFWMQYAEHQKTGRSADIIQRIETDDNDPNRFFLGVVSTNKDESIESRYSLTLSYGENLQSYYYLVKALLRVLPGKVWIVTHNPLHGELEYCNFYPSGAFQREKLWQFCCYEPRGGPPIRVPHHHLPTSDKVFTPFKKGGRVFYLLADENPVIQLLGETAENTAGGLLYTMPGLCAYMFDIHLAYRVCESPKPVLLSDKETFTAEFALYEVNRTEAEKVFAQSMYLPPPEIDSLPVFTEGVNTFSKTIDEINGNLISTWSWSMEYGEDWHSPFGEELNALDFTLDREVGYHDSHSLRISASKNCSARWAYTALGEPFFQKPFGEGKEYQLTAYVKTKELRGRGSTVGIRLHREDRQNPDSIFDWGRYEHYYADRITGTNDWTRVQITTPRIDPKPDRVHLLLEHSGEGTTWFDDVEFKQIG